LTQKVSKHCKLKKKQPKTQNLKVLRIKNPIVKNVRMLRDIIFKLPRASQLPYKAQIFKNTVVLFILFIVQYVSRFVHIFPRETRRPLWTPVEQILYTAA